MRRLRSLLDFLLAAGLAFLVTVDGAAAGTGPEVRIGILHHRGKDVVERHWGPLVAYLNERIPEYRFRAVPLDYADLHPAVTERRVDLTFTAAGQYIELEMRHGATRIATVETTGPRGRVSEYGGVFVVRASDGAIGKLEERIRNSMGGVPIEAEERIRNSMGGVPIEAEGCACDGGLSTDLIGQ